MSPGQDAARDILHHALERVLPEPALRRYVSLDETTQILSVAGRKYDLRQFKRIFVVGGGKAARRTGSELAGLLGDRVTSGVLNVYQEQAREPISDRIRLFGADHPTPNEAGVMGARQMAGPMSAMKKARSCVAGRRFEMATPPRIGIKRNRASS